MIQPSSKTPSAVEAFVPNRRYLQKAGGPRTATCPTRNARLWGVALTLLSLILTVVTARAQSDSFSMLRHRMVDEQIRKRGIQQPEVLSAMEGVPRHLFVPEEYRREAYNDYALPIGWGQTISQPYIVAIMVELLELSGEEKVLEIGTGSGYHAAVLSRVAGEVYSMEIIESLGKQAEESLERLGYANVHVRVGDGYQGWPEEAPFDGIILTAAPPKVPQPLIEQLKVGGKMVVPLGSFFQDLLVITKTPDGIEKRNVIPVRFVPMTGEIQEEK